MRTNQFFSTNAASPTPTPRQPHTIHQRLGRRVSASWILPLLLLLPLPAAVQAQDYAYTTYNGTITITGYTGPGGAVTIPSTINGLPVTSIGDRAFYYFTSLTTITIPNSVTNIGYQAFYYCTSLTNVTIGNGLKSIGFRAFFLCTRLTAITVDALNPTYSSADGVLFNESQTTLIQCPEGKAGAYTIPSSVTSIDDASFFYCTNLANVTIGNSVTNVGYQAFYYCTSLTNVTIGNGLINIGDYAFYYCTSLTNLTIGNGLKSIGFRVFFLCTRLTGITVDALNPTYSSADGVLFNKSQTTLIQCPEGKAGAYTIPSSVTSIGASSFFYCINLANVTIGNSVTNIGEDAFAFCSSLTNVTIGNGVTNIGDYAFASCSSMTSVTIPNSVINIGDDAFALCTNLTSVYFKGNAPSVYPFAFSGDINTTIYYLPGTMGWGPTFGGRPAVLWNPQVQTTDGSFGVRQNQFGFNIAGTPGIPLVVEASADLAAAPWTPLQACTLTNGLLYFSDPQWTNHPGRFYRIRSP